MAAIVGGAVGLGNSGFDLGQTLGVKNGYQAATAPGTQEQLAAGQTAFNQNIAGQNALIQALQAQAAGTGVNPAQAQLNQATNQNIAQNTGMIASQKGINPALAVRMAGQNAAAMNQQAAGQAAVMQAQQQVNAQNQIANVYGNIGNQALAQQNIAQQGFYAPQAINAGVAAGNQQTNAKLIGGGISGAATAMAGFAHGGTVPAYAGGGMATQPQDLTMSLDPVSNAYSFFNEQMHPKEESGGKGQMIGQIMGASSKGGFAHGGKVPAMVSPGEKFMNPQEAEAFAHGHQSYEESGEMIPGKAKVKGDSYQNDTVPKNLDEGGIVIPRHITQGKNPGEEAKRFVEAELAKSNKAPGKAYADGGAVGDGSDITQQTQNAIQGGISQAQQGAGMENLPSKEDQFNKRVADYAQANRIDLNDPSQKQGVEQLVLNQFKKENVAGQWAQHDQAQEQQRQMQFQQEKSDVLGTTPKQQPASPQSAQPLAQATQRPVQQNPFGPYQSELMKGLGMQQQAVGLQAQGEQQLAKGQLDVLQRQQQDLQQQQQAYEQKYADIDQETQQAAQDLKNSKIDPNHYWGDKSTASKISSGIGLILGGIGAGLTGGENQALKYINMQIDRDIQAQTQNMDKQKNLMTFNMQRMGNLRAAQAATAAMHLQTFQNELAQEGAKAQSPIIQARAMQANAQIQQMKAEYQKQAALYSSLGNAQAGGGGDNGQQTLNTLRMIDPKRAEEMEGRYIPGVGFGSVKIPDKVREEIAGRHELEVGIQKLQKFAQQHQGSLDPATVNEGKALANQVQDAYRRANGQGVFREAEADFVKGVIAEDPTAFFAKYRTSPKYRSALEQNRAALNSKLQAYGFQGSRDLSQLEGKPVK